MNTAVTWPSDGARGWIVAGDRRWRAVACMAPLSRLRGLLGRRRIDAALLAPCRAVHVWAPGRRIRLYCIDAAGVVLRIRDRSPWQSPVFCPAAWAIVEVDARVAPADTSIRRLMWLARD